MGKIVHIVLWKLKQPPTVAAEAVEAAKKSIDALKSVPGYESMHLGPPIADPRNKGYDWGMYSVFASKEALDKYAVSKEHVEVRDNQVKPHITDALAYDFELDA